MATSAERLDIDNQLKNPIKKPGLKKQARGKPFLFCQEKPLFFYPQIAMFCYSVICNKYYRYKKAPVKFSTTVTGALYMLINYKHRKLCFELSQSKI